MNKFSRVLLFFLLSFFLPTKIQAVYDPLSRPNNFHGIHILFPSELDSASELVNSENGTWGYVTIPIQSTDRDLDKWQEFMNKAREKKLIPIVRLATEPYFKDSSVWRKPEKTDIIDFANFLNSLEWPVENKYVIVFNEINRFDEWGGEAPNPSEYADILSFAVDTFKARSNDFYIIMGGLDNASPNDGVKYLDNIVYLQKISDASPDVFKKIDGFSSHSYPNPGFSQPPVTSGSSGISAYKYEFDLINKSSGKKVPVFITETGWVTDKLSPDVIANYYKVAHEEIWSKDSDKIAAITPFLLNSTGGQFENFSFIINGQKTKQFEVTKALSKVPGSPIETVVKVAEAIDFIPAAEMYFKKKDTTQENSNTLSFVTEYIKFFF